MSEWILIDTDILIDAARGVPAAAEYLDHTEATAQAAISIITQMKLLVGLGGVDGSALAGEHRGTLNLRVRYHLDPDRFHPSPYYPPC